ncbi:NAD(P) transhydrogenase subunit alpha [Marixanthomonas spongiae]|uniref:proton-translocating NAD(P)(+) transhydrogenase n=1 Tax=Marixanthomonas spongiae TaxID=2174845 RepID=A0A2U0HUS0_9FLAO|nr:NAD(P) transhydrogenase subunit alpha [Marixanthomonas spongiae]PVW12613.1 NAD(P) transhydrogenase subunit alpha [Marixanthomonas spongiae]
MKTLGLVKEPEFENRICFLPKEIKQLSQQFEVEIFIEPGLGERLGIPDTAYQEAGATVNDRETVLNNTDCILSINQIDDFVVNGKPNTHIGIFNMLYYPERSEKYLNKATTVYSLDLLPRTTLAQSMDVLSSMASLAGYKAVLKATAHYSGSLPMFTTAAGTLNPAKVLVLGAGVAGLQAIATAKRLGAIVEAFDVRKSAGEEVRSLGAKFVAVEGAEEAKDAGGYAVAQSEEYLKKQKQLIHERVRNANIVICTANIPGKKAPLLLEKNTVEAMQPGSVIIDMAAEQGGNCEVSQPGKTIDYNSITIIGDSHLSREVAQAASQLLSTNYYNFLKYLLQSTKEDDELLQKSKVIDNGTLTNPILINKFELA